MSLIDALRAAAGPSGVLTDPADMAPHLAEWRGRHVGAAAAVVRPASTAEVAAVVRACAERGVAVVPQGGNTGLVGGGVPDLSGGQVVLSLSRMNRIRDLDPLDNSVVAEAGCVLAAVRAAAEEADRVFPLSLASEGTAQVGGLVSTNAGGTMTIRYGNMREQVLGLEVVLPDGRVWDGLRRLRKDTTGYDLKQWFVGAEGTLGIVTAAALRLMPRPRQVETAFCAVPDPAAAVRLLARMRGEVGEMLTAFELIPRIGIEYGMEHVPGVVDPLDAPSPWYVLAEAAAAAPIPGFRDLFEQALGAALEAGEATDAALAASEAQRRAFWHAREMITEARRIMGGGINHDVTVPTSRIPAFIDEADAVAARLEPGVRVCCFGHVGDGNLHYNLNPAAGADKAAFVARAPEISRAVHDVVLAYGGSISAEHGIGAWKRAELHRVKDPLSLEMMRALKAALDPRGIMNPGKVV
jgi:FAD/FMN-containing dehydrogenase